MMNQVKKKKEVKSTCILDPNEGESSGEDEEEENNIRLIKKVYGNPEVIQSTYVEWKINTWYRFAIVY